MCFKQCILKFKYGNFLPLLNTCCDFKPKLSPGTKQQITYPQGLLIKYNNFIKVFFVSEYTINSNFANV